MWAVGSWRAEAGDKIGQESIVAIADVLLSMVKSIALHHSRGSFFSYKIDHCTRRMLRIGLMIYAA